MLSDLPGGKKGWNCVFVFVLFGKRGWGSRVCGRERGFELGCEFSKGLTERGGFGAHARLRICMDVGCGIC